MQLRKQIFKMWGIVWLVLLTGLFQSVVADTLYMTDSAYLIRARVNQTPPIKIRPSVLYSVDTQNGEVTPIGSVGYYVADLAWDRTTGTLYGVTSKFDALHNGLIKIDTSTGAGTPIGTTKWGSDQYHHIVYIDIDSSGNMYGGGQEVGFGGDNGNTLTNLIKINKTAGTFSFIGVFGQPAKPNPDGTLVASYDVMATEQLFFDKEDTLWVKDNSNLYDMDPVTGATSIIYRPEPNGEIISDGLKNEIPQKSHGAFDRSTGVYWDLRRAKDKDNFIFTKYDISTGKLVGTITVPNSNLLTTVNKAPALAFANDNDNASDVAKGTTFINDSNISLGTNRGHVTNNGFIGGDFDNYGIIDSYSDIEGGFINHEGGIINVVGCFHPLFGIVENFGTINLLPSVREYPVTSVEMTGGTFNNHGTYRIDTPVKSGGTMNNRGVFEITPRGSYLFMDSFGYRQQPGGRTIVDGVLHDTGHLHGLSGGTLSGSGTVIAEMGIVGGRNAFAISPGSPIGTLTLLTPRATALKST